jgi:branched-chain amino acid transport system permease protein
MADPTYILQIIVTGLLVGGVYGLTALGLSIIFGVMNIVNFAQGDFMMLAMYATFFLYTLFGVFPLVSLLIVIPLFFVLGMGVQKFIINRVIDKPPMTHLLITLGLSIVLKNVALAIFKADHRSVITPLAISAITLGPLHLNQAHVVAFVSAIIMTFIVSTFLNRTYFGKAIRATADDKEAAMMMGINIHHVYLVAFGLGIALVGSAGVLVSLYYPISPAVAWDFIVLMFVAVVLGGLGSVKGALVGGIIVGLVQSVSTIWLSVDLRNIAVFTAFVIILLVKPSGLFGVKSE